MKKAIANAFKPFNQKSKEFSCPEVKKSSIAATTIEFRSIAYQLFELPRLPWGIGFSDVMIIYP
jgi:hypothetical protein